MPPLIHNFFSIPEIYWRTEGSLYNDFRFGPVRQKNSANLDAPPSYAWKFSIKSFSETPQCSPMKHFGTVRQKLFDGKTWYPLLWIRCFDTPNFLKHWREAHEIFQHCETQIFRRRNVIPPIMHKIFRYPKSSETFKGCPRNFSALWDPKFSTENVIPPFSSTKLFETRNFLKSSNIPLRNFSALWDMKNLTENRDLPPLIHKFFSIP